MGEFSAGKSTLSNLLIQSTALPVNVTATQLPPVWISKGNEAPYRVGLDGRRFDLELEQLEDVSVEDTAFIRIFHDAELLDHCDLIDMPGISDPNMDADVWQRVITYADAVIWCTHATQAWRQSEAAVWSMLPQELYPNSFLLLTRMDKILSERDQLRVVKRVGRETVGLFKELFPISLTRALKADGDPEKWSMSGAEDFSNGLHALLAEIGERKAEYASSHSPSTSDDPAKYVMPSRVQPKKLLARRSTSRPVSAPAPLPPL
ncbi:MAG: dynamin family protein [Boseongicola sp.]|nr:dynamin family protein [Boseongicola sp.]